MLNLVNNSVVLPRKAAFYPCNDVYMVGYYTTSLTPAIKLPSLPIP